MGVFEWDYFPIGDLVGSVGSLVPMVGYLVPLSEFLRMKIVGGDILNIYSSLKNKKILQQVFILDVACLTKYVINLDVCYFVNLVIQICVIVFFNSLKILLFV